MTCRSLAGAQLLMAWNLLWWKQQTGILSRVSEGNQREGGGGWPCPAIPAAAGHQPPSPRPGQGIVASSGRQVSGPGHFTGSCPEKQGLGATPAGLESKHEKAYLQRPSETPVLPKPYAGHLLPPRMDHGPSLLFPRTETPNQQFSQLSPLQ